MYSLKDSLKGSLKRLGLEKKLREKRIVELWDELRFGEMANHSQAAYFTNGILFVTVSSPVWSQQLLFLKRNFIEEINKELNGRFLKDIRFQCGVIQKKNCLDHNQEIIPSWEQIGLEQEEIKEIERITENIEEKEIRDKFKSFIIKGKKLKKWRQDRGWKACPLCFCLYPQDEEKCPFCSLEKELKKMLFSDPYLNWNDCGEKLPNLTEKEYQQIKKKIVDNIWENIKNSSSSEILEKFNQEKAKKLVIFTEIYVILKTGLDLSLINKEIVYSVLGEDIARVFYDLKNKLKEGA